MAAKLASTICNVRMLKLESMRVLEYRLGRHSLSEHTMIERWSNLSLQRLWVSPSRGMRTTSRVPIQFGVGNYINTELPRFLLVSDLHTHRA